MPQTEKIILLIWIFGIVFNLLMVKKIFPDEWVSWIAIGIILIEEKIREWYNTKRKKV